MYDFIARNSTELSVQQGETLEVTRPTTSGRTRGEVLEVLSDSAISSLEQVLESSKRWWKCRNYFNQVGFVPFNILQPVSHVESPVSSRPLSVRDPHITPAVPRPEHTSRLLSAPPSRRRRSRPPSRRPSPWSRPARRFYTPHTPRSGRAAYRLTARTYQLQMTRKIKVPACLTCVCVGGATVHVSHRKQKLLRLQKFADGLCDCRLFSLKKNTQKAWLYGTNFESLCLR